MSRIKGVQDAEAGMIAKQIFKSTRKTFGDVPEPLRIMAKNGAVMSANIGFELGIGRAKSVEPSLKNLVSTKAASMIGCLF